MKLTLPSSCWLLIALFCGPLAAFQNDVVDPDSLGLSAEILANFDSEMQKALQQGDLVGCSAMIVKDAKVCYFKTWGQQNRQKAEPVSRDTIWRIYSMTKPITSVAAMQLAEQGRLELDAPVAKYIPSFANLKVAQESDGKVVEVEPKRAMTVRDLLRHTSGLSYGFFGDTETDRRYRKAGVLMYDKNLADMAHKLSQIPLLYHPGQRFHYSASTDVLGHIVELVSTKSFDDYLRENIFEPLEMKDTFFTVPEEKQARFAEMYRPARDGEGLVPANKMSSYRFLNDNEFYSGGGGLCATIDDYRRFCDCLLAGGQINGKQIIQRKSLQQMWTNQLDEVDQKSGSFKFGLGFRISPEGDYSWGGAAGTRFWINPEKNLAMIYMVQINPYRQRFGQQFRRTVYQALK